MRKWKRRAAPSGAGVAASQHLLHLEERVVVVLERGREKEWVRGGQTHTRWSHGRGQKQNWRTEIESRWSCKCCEKKTNMHLEKLWADADVILEPHAAVSQLDLMTSLSEIQKHFHYEMYWLHEWRATHRFLLFCNISDKIKGRQTGKRSRMVTQSTSHLHTDILSLSRETTCKAKPTTPAAGSCDIWELRPQSHFNHLHTHMEAWKQLIRADLW